MTIQFQSNLALIHKESLCNHLVFSSEDHLTASNPCFRGSWFRFEILLEVFFVKTLVISLFNHSAFHHLLEIPSVILRSFIFVKGLSESS